MNFNKANYFLKSFFAESASIKDFIVTEPKDIEYIENNKVFKKICHSSLKLCVLAMLDGRPLKESMKEFDKHMKTFEVVANKKESNLIEFGWVNATCQIDFGKNFDVSPDLLPRVVFILPSIKKYAIMYSSFEDNNIINTIDQLMLGKIPLQDFDNEKIYLRNTLKCDHEYKEESKDEIEVKTDI